MTSSPADLLAQLDPSAAGDRSAIRVVRAPGRVNLIGEHTDYNEGFVLPIAIDRSITIAFHTTNDRRVTVTLADTGETASFDLDTIPPRTGGWIDYVAGTAWAMADAGLAVSGFRGVIASDLPQGAGLSSSAALELASALALSAGEEPPVDRLQLARIAQRAENEYVGVACGLMDQFASACGRRGAALLLDCRTLGYEPVPVPHEDVALMVINSGSSRRLDSSAYNERRAQCQAAVGAIAKTYPGVRTLRDVTAEMLEVETDLDPLLARRARHVVAENARVVEAAAALRCGDVETVGRLFTESHASLRDLYEVSSAELDALVEISISVPGVFGTRLTGAGFGGCTITLVRRGSVDELAQSVMAAYPKRTGLRPEVFEVEAADGAEVVDVG